jgi:hypothetical protein
MVGVGTQACKVAWLGHNHLIPEQNHHRKNLPNQATQLATIETEQTNQNATKAVAFSIWAGNPAIR